MQCLTLFPPLLTFCHLPKRSVYRIVKDETSAGKELGWLEDAFIQGHSRGRRRLVGQASAAVQNRGLRQACQKVQACPGAEPSTIIRTHHTLPDYHESAGY